MADYCEMVLVRHGQTAYNAAGRLQGQIDIPLDETGIAQVRATAGVLKHWQFDAAYSSDLGRAVHTAREIIAFHPGLELYPVPGLREWNLGEMEGRIIKDLWQEYPDVMEAFREPVGDVAVPGGENRSQLVRRVSDTIEQIAAKHPGQRVLLVSHGGAIQCIFEHVTGTVKMGNIRPLCANAGFSVIRRKADGWQLVSWNESNHLHSLGLHELL